MNIKLIDKRIMDKADNIVKESNDKNKLAEIILYDVLDNVFVNLNLKDLYRAAVVCKSWKDTADREILKRNEIQYLVLRMPEDADWDDSDEETDIIGKYKWHISESLRSLPNLALLFCDDNRPSCDAPYDCYRKYYWDVLKHGTNLGIIHSLKVTMNTTDIIGILGVGIMIPSTPRLKIDTYYIVSDDVEGLSHGNELFNIVDQAVNTLITTQTEHNCFIFFFPRDQTITRCFGNDPVYCRLFRSEFLKRLKEKCKPGTYSLWGGDVSYLKATDDRCDLETVYMIRLSGPAIKSWSIVLKSNLSNTIAEYTLLNFKQSIRFKLNTIAIAMVPSNKNESYEQRLAKTKVFRKVFSKISLLSIYQEELSFQIGCDSTNFDSDPILLHKDSVAYLIISSE